MMGLIKKDLMVSGFKLKHIFVFLIFIIGLFFLEITREYIPLIAYGIMLFAPLIFFLSISNYMENDDYKTEILFPIRKRTIVRARFLEYFIISLICITLIYIMVYAKQVFDKTQLESHQINLLATGIGMTLIYGGLVLCMMFVVGQDRIKEIGIAAFIFTLIPVRLFMEIVKKVLGLTNVFDFYNYTNIILAFIGFSIVFFLISYLVSILIFMKKEY